MHVATMHIPDGFINGPTSLIAILVAVLGIIMCLVRARRELDERTAPLAGLVAVYVFAMQMLNFPVAAGTSGHLLGGALAAILVGPYAGALAVSVVILVQGLLFADGGLSALGLNIINMGLVTAIVGWLVFRALIRALGVSRPRVFVAAFAAGFVSVPVSALAFVLEYAVGGTGTVDVKAVLIAMVSVHALIGIGEGVITALTVVAVYLVRPDLVFGLRGARIVGRERAVMVRRSTPWVIVIAGLVVSLVAAVFVSRFASSSPDGLEKVAADQGFLDHGQTSPMAVSPAADYAIPGLGDSSVSVALAGLVGVLVMAALAFGLFLILRASKRRRPNTARPHSHGHDAGERLYLHRHTPIHGLPAEVKTVSMIAFILIVVFTPPTAYWAFAAYGLMLIVVAVLARIPARVILPRMLVEVPFVIFALLMPFFGTGETVEVLGLTLHVAGLIAMGNILIKGTLGVVASILLAATTPARDLLLGLERLRVPSLLVQIASFMLRYVHVISDEMSRMRLAREARGFRATGVRSWPVIAHSGGALFIRSYERGERVHLAMLSRGYTGRLPVLDPQTTTRADWLVAMVLPAMALVILLAVWVSR